jgi:uncharacterized membrane protein required for colicin V production
MTILDWVLLGFVALAALGGLRTGLVATLLSLAGLVAGAVIGARVAPEFLTDEASAEYSALVGLAGALVGAVVLRAAARIAGSFVRGGLRFLPPLRSLDSLGGLALGAAWGLALVWVAASVAVQLRGHPEIRKAVRQSHVITRLNEIAPPGDVLKLQLRVDGIRLPLGL